MMVARHLLAAAGLALLIGATQALAASDMRSVSIVDVPRPQPRWGFAPATETVQPETWVTWSNSGQDAHTVTAADGSFDSGNLDPSEGFSWFFDQPGTYAYVCSLHPWMQGRIVVADPSPDGSPQAANA